MWISTGWPAARRARLEPAGRGILPGVHRLLTLPLTPVTKLLGAVSFRAGRSSTAPPAALASPAGTVTSSPGRRPGKYEQPLVALATARPGVTVAEAADELDVPATALYPALRRLQERGELVKRGRGLHPPTEPTPPT